MAPTRHHDYMECVQMLLLRGEPMIAVSSSGVNAPLAAASHGWLTKYFGEPPNIIREEPPDQMSAALAQSGDAVAVMTEHRALLARNDGLDYRRLSPTPLVEYGVAYIRDNPTPALASLLKTVADVAAPLSEWLPPGNEVIWPPRSGNIVD